LESDGKDGEIILDVGSGSGYTTALLAHMVGLDGFVFGVELVPDLVDKSKENLKKYAFQNITIVKALPPLGLAEYGPYDKILVSAASEEIPTELIDQLKPGGVMVIPVKNVIYKIRKTSDYVIEGEFSGFIFVPLIR
jgi:protein-L-isoaspartate(D-aspartate) O-methyltransferase